MKGRTIIAALLLVVAVCFLAAGPPAMREAPPPGFDATQKTLPTTAITAAAPTAVAKVLALATTSHRTVSAAVTHDWPDTTPPDSGYGVVTSALGAIDYGNRFTAAAATSHDRWRDRTSETTLAYLITSKRDPVLGFHRQV